MHPARRALVPLLVALTALVAEAGTSAAAQILPTPTRVCVAPATWQPGMEIELGTSQARSLPSLPPGETDDQPEDIMIVVELIHDGVY